MTDLSRSGDVLGKDRVSVQHSIGKDKISISIVHKTKTDLVVSNYAVERFFLNAEDAQLAVEQIVHTLAHAPVEVDGEDDAS